MTDDEIDTYRRAARADDDWVTSAICAMALGDHLDAREVDAIRDSDAADLDFDGVRAALDHLVAERRCVPEIERLGFTIDRSSHPEIVSVRDAEFGETLFELPAGSSNALALQVARIADHAYRRGERDGRELLQAEIAKLLGVVSRNEP